MSKNLEELVREAQGGSERALHAVVESVQDQIYRLAMRILVNPQDAQEATQEILILVVTKLSTFEGKSAFTTWVYRVATNYLLSAKKILDRDLGLTFEMFGADLETGLVDTANEDPDKLLMLNELRIACTSAMLLCLDMKHRLAYVLGDIFELEHAEAAQALSISKENYRKRLSRARKQVVDFTSGYCGLASRRAKCRCARRLSAAEQMGRVSEERITYAIDDAPAYTKVKQEVRELVEELKVLKLQQATASYRCPEQLVEEIKEAVRAR